MAAHADSLEDSRGAGFVSEVNRLFSALGAPLRLAPVPGTGYGVVATRQLPAGTRILIESPLVLTVNKEHRHHVCASCLADCRPRGLARWSRVCEGCGALFFCSAKCAAASRELHSATECAAFAAACDADDAEPVIDLVVQAVRMLCLRAGGGSGRPFAGVEELRVGFGSYASRLQGFRRTKRTGTLLKQAVVAALRALPADAPAAARVPPAELYAALNRHQASVCGRKMCRPPCAARQVALERIRARLRTPERRPSSLEARRRRRSPPRAAPKSEDAPLATRPTCTGCWGRAAPGTRSRASWGASSSSTTRARPTAESRT